MSDLPPPPAVPESAWVQFESFEYSGVDPAAERLEDNEYLNPILAGFYPDPSIFRVGDDYYLVNSTFAWFPGVPIFHSRDLVNWTQIGHVLDRPSQLPLDGQGVSEGIFAPTISYHDGTFYMITTNVRGGGNFFVTAKDPAGPWSDPVWLKEINGIDPSFFFDDETGKSYIIHNGPPPENRSLYDGHRALWLWEFDRQAQRVVGEGKIIVNGGTDLSKKPVWIEGPHIFRHGEYYYIIAAEGGTSTWHSQVVFRSETMDGPWTPFEGNPILTQRHLPGDRAEPVTNTGHADFVELPNGDWWAVFLACRPYEKDFTNIGRETFMLPVRWENGWPIVLEGDAIVDRTLPRPNLPAQPKATVPLTGTFSITDRFEQDELAKAWIMLRTPKEKWYAFDEDGGLLLAPRAVDLTSRANPSLLARRQQHADFSATTTLVLDEETAKSEAGLVAIQNGRFYYFLGVRIEGGVAREIFVEQNAGRQTEGRPVKLITVSLPDGVSRIDLKITGQGRDYSFHYRPENGEWTPLLEDADGTILSTTIAGGFVGTCLGMFAREAE